VGNCVPGSNLLAAHRQFRDPARCAGARGLATDTPLLGTHLAPDIVLRRGFSKAGEASKIVRDEAFLAQNRLKSCGVDY
jgi:hypothetical protein